MSYPLTLVTLPRVTDADITFVTRLTTLKTYNLSRSISPTKPWSIIHLLLTLPSIIRLPTILRTFVPLFINHLMMSIIILIINPTAVHQIWKHPNLLIPYRLLDIRAYSILELNAL